MSDETNLDDRLTNLHDWLLRSMGADRDLERFESKFNGIREAVKAIRADEAAKERERIATILDEDAADIASEGGSKAMARWLREFASDLRTNERPPDA